MSPVVDEAVFVCPPDHKHAANTTCYTGHRCRCTPCRAANTARANRDRRLQAYGRYEAGRLAPEPIAEHIAHLRQFGYSYVQIAAAAGINEATPYRLAHGQLKFVFGRVGRAILAVNPTIEDLSPTTLIPARGTQRRIQALATRGWSVKAIADHAGWTRTRMSHVLWNGHITVTNHLTIAGIYDELWDRTPDRTTWYDDRTIRKTITRAQALGWMSPLAWDDIDTDPTPPPVEPDTDVDEIAIALAVAGDRVRLTRAERHVAVTTLNRDRGYDDQLISRMLGVSDKTIARDREYLNLPAAVGPDKERIAA